MAIYKGNTKIVKLYKGSTQIVKRYKGTDLIYSASRLPAEFQEVEYIESSGTQYIDSGVDGNNNSGVDMTFAFTYVGGSYGYALGGLVSGSYRFAPLFYDATNAGKFLFSDSISFSALNEYGDADTNKHYLSFNYPNRNIIYDNVLIKQTAGTFTNTTGNSIYLFARNFSGASLKVYMKLYSCKIYDNSVLIRDFVPCYRKADNVAGLYDLVNGVFYTNAGTGTFIVGGNV